MRTVFFLGRRTSDDEIELLYSFGIRRPTRAEVRLRHAEYPQADVLASFMDVEDERRLLIKVHHELSSGHPPSREYFPLTQANLKGEI